MGGDRPEQTGIAWFDRARVRLIRKIIVRYAFPSARRLYCAPDYSASDLIGEWHMRSATVEQEVDIAVVALRQPSQRTAQNSQQTIESTLLRRLSPGGLLILDSAAIGRGMIWRHVNELRAAGFDRIQPLHYGFLMRLCFLFPGGLALLQRCLYSSLCPARAWLQPLMYLEVFFLPYIHFLFGTRTLLIARKVESLPVEPVDLSIVIPAYNESKRIFSYLDAIQAYVSERSYSTEIIVVNDGSRDDTGPAVRNRYVNVRVVDLFQNQGKGAAVGEGVRLSGGEYILTADADGATPIHELESLLPLMRSGADVVLGSRYLQTSKVTRKQSLIRRIISRGGNLLIRLIAGLPFQDTQCGFKLYRRNAARVAFVDLINRRFGFDFEVLRRARMAGFQLIEHPVTWQDQDGSTLKPRDVIQVLLDLFRFRFQYILRFSVVGVANTVLDLGLHNLLIIIFGFGDDAREFLYHAGSFLTANIFSYMVNSSFTFQRHGQYWKFFTISIVVFLSSLGAFYLSQQVFAVTSTLALNLVKVGIVPVNFMVNYFGYKILVYRIRS